MKIRLLFLFFIFALSQESSMAHSNRSETQFSLSELYSLSDRSIKNFQQYIETKEHRLSVLCRQHEGMSNLQACYELADGLYREYYSYSNDSTLVWLGHGLEPAKALKRKDLPNNHRLLLVNQYRLSGFYSGAIFHFQQVPLERLSMEDRINYYFVGGHFYGNLAFLSKDSQIVQQYYHIIDQYNDSLNAIASYNSIPYLRRKTERLNDSDQYQEALKTSTRWEGQVSYGTHDYAIMAFLRVEIYCKMENRNEQKHWLAISALYDINSTVTDQSSLWNLASLLSEDGDNDRAYQYMDFSWTCVSHFSAHMRSWLASPILTLINNNYRGSLQNTSHYLMLLIAVVNLLSIILLGIISCVQHKWTQLAKARNELKGANSGSEILNEQLSNANMLLSSTNHQLSGTNKMKGEYIGKFLSTCSEYIDKLDNYRIKINRKLKARQYNDLLKMTETDELESNGLNELLYSFDTVFLHLFPSFVSDLNVSFQPEHRIHIPHGGQLTTGLRVFALIRLGIKESSRITEFLSHSSSSIYNHRVRIKKKVLCDCSEFKKRVKDITMQDAHHI